MSLALELGLIYLVSKILLTLTRRSRSKTGMKQDRSTLGMIWLVIAVSIVAGVFLAQNFRVAALPHGRMFASAGVVLFVAGLILREIFKTLPEHAELRHVLNGPCLPMLLKADALPPYLKELGAGQSYHIAILSPAGLTPLAIFDHVTGDPKSLATNIADCLEKVSRLWSA